MSNVQFITKSFDDELIWYSEMVIMRFAWKRSTYIHHVGRILQNKIPNTQSESIVYEIYIHVRCKYDMEIYWVMRRINQANRLFHLFIIILLKLRSAISIWKNLNLNALNCSSNVWILIERGKFISFSYR